MKWGGGTYEYTVPFTGNYEITLSGAQGASYSGNSGGYGYTLSKTIRLQYQDKLKVVVGTRPAWTQSGGVISVPGGNASSLYLNDTLIWTAAGGAGQIDNNTAPNGVTSVNIQGGNGTSIGSWTNSRPVHWHSGNGKSGATHSNSFPTLYQLFSPGGCYTGSHTCGKVGSDCHWEHSDGDWLRCGARYHKGCPNPDSDPTGVAYICDRCGHVAGENDPGTCSEMYRDSCSHWICNHVVNTWNIGCGYNQGQIYGYDNSSYTAGTCYCNTSYSYTEKTVERDTSISGFGFNYVDKSKTINTTPSSSSLTRTGNGNFKISLVEQQQMFGSNLLNAGSARTVSPFYLNGKCNLILLDHTVVHFKR